MRIYRRSSIRRRAVFLSGLAILTLTGCAANPYAEPPPPLSATAKAVRVTSNPEATAGCKFVSNIEMPDFKVFSRQPTKEEFYDRVKEEAAKLGGNLVYDHNGLEAYRCPEANAATCYDSTSGKPRPCPPPAPRPASSALATGDAVPGEHPPNKAEEAPRQVVVRLFDSIEAVKGCTMMGEVDESIACPDSYRTTRNQCALYRAAKMGGNAVLDKAGAPYQVFRCPEPADAR